MARARHGFDRGFSNFQRWLRDLPRNARYAQKKPIWTATLKIAALVRARYRDLDAGKRSGMVNKMAVAGKEKGVQPARVPLAEGFTGMELFARHVRQERKGNVSRVFMSETAVHPTRGLPLQLLAHLMEHPVPITLPGSFRAFIYWMIVKEGRGGWGTRKIDRPVPNRPWKPDIVYTPEPKEVWRYVYQKMMMPTVAKYMWPELRNNLKKMAKTYGAKTVR